MLQCGSSTGCSRHHRSLPQGRVAVGRRVSRARPSCRAAPADDLGPEDARSRLSWLNEEAPVGSEHGQGFLTVRPSGTVLRVDVDMLNEQLKHQGALRLRHAHRPDEAFGMVFSFDGVLADTTSARQHAWAALALSQGRRLPSLMLARPELWRSSPEYVLTSVLRWATNRKEAQALAWELGELQAEALGALHAPLPGVREWLDALTNFNVPIALVTGLDRQTARRCLERMALHDHFDAMVTAEDEAETLAQRLLTAAVKLHRPPNLCVFHTATPEGVVAAHNCSMRAVAVQGEYHPHQLRAADATCGALSELAVYNVRRLFSNAGSEFMDLQKQTSSKDDDSNRRRRGRLAIGTLDAPR